MTRRRRPRAGNQLFEKGLLSIFLGCGLLIAPVFLGTSSMLLTFAQGLKTPAWLAIVLGVALLTIHWVVTRKTTASSNPKRAQQIKVLPGSKDMFPPEIPPAPGNAERAIGEVQRAASRCASKQPRWGKQVLDEIEWRRFEAVCQRLFSQAGFETKSQSHGADGGVDIWLYSKNSQGPAAVVQCKHWVEKPVGVKELREFFGVMASKGLKRGTFVTSSTYTASAIEFAKDNGINALDGRGLLTLIGRRSEQQQNELLEIAYEGDYWRPTCASCGVKMIDRVSAKDGGHFWGCVNFPRCRTRMTARRS